MKNFLKHLKWRAEVLAYDIVHFFIRAYPFELVSSLGGKLFAHIGPKTSKHHIAKTNMRLAFPDATDEQIDIWLKQSWNQMGRTFAEFPMLCRIKVFAKNSRVEVRGLEQFKAVAKAGKGAIIVTGHFANWEIMAAVLSQAGLPVHITYRPVNNPYFDKRVRAQRASYGIKLMVAKSGAKGAKELISALKKGESIAVLNDQKFNEGIEIPFFGHGAMTATGPTKLALKTGAPLIPMTVTRLAKARFRVEFHDPIVLKRSKNASADIKNGVEQITHFIEDHIRKNPTDWFWVHRRWPKDMYKK